jgi:GT2 family glycosyltransferase
VTSRLAIIIVSWNTRDLLRRCIASVRESLRDSGIPYRIIVVDNASHDGTPEMLRAEFPEVILLELGRNLGFAGGNNLALRRVFEGDWGGQGNREQGIGNRAYSFTRAPAHPRTRAPAHPRTPEYILLLNPDTEIVGDAIARMARYLDEHLDVAVVGPQLRYADGSAQPSRRRFPTRATFFWESTPLEQRRPGNPWARRYRMADRPDNVEQEVGWLVGAALLVRTSAIERAGLLDAGFLMYSEELEWQRRIRLLEMRDWRLESQHQSPISHLQSPKIIYLPNAVIIHHEGKSSEQAFAQRYINFHSSRLRYARMVYGARFAKLLRIFLIAAYGAECMTEAAKWLVGHKRDLRAQRMQVYRQLLSHLVKWR